MRRLALPLCLLFGLPALSAPASAQVPSDPRCLALIGGTAGLLVGGDDLPSADQLAGRPGGYGRIVSPALAAALPRAVVFKSPTQTFSGAHAFALRDGVVYVRPATLGRSHPGEPWRLLKLPDCLAGRVREISADGRLLIALTADHQVYANDMPGDDVSPERWTWRWGPYFWTGLGVRMFADARSWATSEITSAMRFRDSSGREQTPIGAATVYALRAGGRRITYLDPWLPSDDSREVCGPRRGTVELAAISASGSTVFAVSRRAELFTRLYDFDVSGANTVFGTYSWQQGRSADDRRWQLPGPAWVRQPVPPGTITDRVTIARTGARSGDLILRIEGRTRHGRIGYWEKAIDLRSARAWRFTRTGGRLAGVTLSRRSPVARVLPDDHRYAGSIAGMPAEITDLNAECSPATLRVHVAPDLPLDLILHTSDGMRQETRAHELDDTPREYNGAIEVPRALYDSLRGQDPRIAAWITAQLGGRRITTSPIALTSTRVRFLAQCWSLTRDGKPARPDRLRVPPDLGMVVARQLERGQDGRPLSAC